MSKVHNYYYLPTAIDSSVSEVIVNQLSKLKLEEAQTNYAFAIAANRLHEVPKFRGLVRKYTKQIRNLVVLRCDLGEV